MILSEKQIRWLDSRGGRNINDVQEDEEGLFVYMGSGNGPDVKVYIPEDKPVSKKGRIVDKYEEDLSDLK